VAKTAEIPGFGIRRLRSLLAVESERIGKKLTKMEANVAWAYTAHRCVRA